MKFYQKWPVEMLLISETLVYSSVDNQSAEKILIEFQNESFWSRIKIALGFKTDADCYSIILEFRSSVTRTLWNINFVGNGKHNKASKKSSHKIVRATPFKEGILL